MDEMTKKDGITIQSLLPEKSAWFSMGRLHLLPLIWLFSPASRPIIILCIVPSVWCSLRLRMRRQWMQVNIEGSFDLWWTYLGSRWERSGLDRRQRFVEPSDFLEYFNPPCRLWKSSVLSGQERRFPVHGKMVAVVRLLMWKFWSLLLFAKLLRSTLLKAKIDNEKRRSSTFVMLKSHLRI